MIPRILLLALLHLFSLLAIGKALRQVEYKEYAKGVIFSPSRTTFVTYLWQCAGICRQQLVCSAFSLKASSRETSALNCSIALGDFNWVNDPTASLFMEDIGPYPGYTLLNDGRFYKYVGVSEITVAHTARMKCQEEGGDLSVTYPKARRDVIMAAFPSNNKYLGITFNPTANGDWVTDDGVTFKTSTSDPNQPWSSGEPNTAGTGLVCVHEYYQKWFSRSCLNHGVPIQVLCRRGDRYERSPFNGKYYKLHQSRANATQAAAICLSEGGTLANSYGSTNWAALAPYRARVDPFAEVSLASKWYNSFYIAGTDKDLEGVWRLPDGTSFNLANRATDPNQRWTSGEPNEGTNANYLVYNPKDGFGDAKETDVNRFLCEVVV